MIIIYPYKKPRNFFILGQSFIWRRSIFPIKISYPWKWDLNPVHVMRRRPVFNLLSYEGGWGKFHLVSEKQVSSAFEYRSAKSLFYVYKIGQLSLCSGVHFRLAISIRYYVWICVNTRRRTLREIGFCRLSEMRNYMYIFTMNGSARNMCDPVCRAEHLARRL